MTRLGGNAVVALALAAAIAVYARPENEGPMHAGQRALQQATEEVRAAMNGVVQMLLARTAEVEKALVRTRKDQAAWAVEDKRTGRQGLKGRHFGQKKEDPVANVLSWDEPSNQMKIVLSSLNALQDKLKTTDHEIDSKAVDKARMEFLDAATNLVGRADELVINAAAGSGPELREVVHRVQRSAWKLREAAVAPADYLESDGSGDDPLLMEPRADPTTEKPSEKPEGDATPSLNDTNASGNVTEAEASSSGWVIGLIIGLIFAVLIAAAIVVWCLVSNGFFDSLFGDSPPKTGAGPPKSAAPPGGGGSKTNTAATKKSAQLSQGTLEKDT